MLLSLLSVFNIIITRDGYYNNDITLLHWITDPCFVSVYELLSQH